MIVSARASRTTAWAGDRALGVQASVGVPCASAAWGRTRAVHRAPKESAVSRRFSILDLPPLLGLDRVRTGPRGQRHVGQRRVHTRGRRHRRPVGDVDVLAGVDLVVGVQHRGLGIAAHSRRTHFVDAEARGIALVAREDLLEARRLQHLGRRRGHVLAHRLLVLADGDVEGQGGQAVLVGLGLVEGHAVIGVGQDLAEAAQAEHPRARLAERGLALGAHARDGAVPALAARAALVAVAAQEIGPGRGLVTEVAEARDVDAVGPAAGIVAVEIARDLGHGAHAQVVIHDVAADLVAVVAEAVGEARAGGVQHDPRRAQRRGAEEDDAGVELDLLAAGLVQHPHAVGPLALGIEDQRGDDRASADLEVARALGGDQGRGVRAEIGPKWAAADAEVPMLALAAAEGDLLLGGGGQVRGAADGDATAQALLDAGLEDLLDAVHLHRRLELSVGALGVALRPAADADEPLDAVVPGGEVGVPDGPVHRDAFTGVGLEVDGTMAIGLPTPGQRAAAQVMTADPVEPLVLGVGVFVVADEEVLGIFGDRVAGALLHLVVRVQFGLGQLALRIGRLPRIGLGGGIVLDMADHGAALEDQGLQALLGQLLGGPAAGGAATDDDGGVGVLRPRPGVEVRHVPPLTRPGGRTIPRTVIDCLLGSMKSITLQAGKDRWEAAKMSWKRWGAAALVVACVTLPGQASAQKAGPWRPIFDGKTPDGRTAKISRHPVGENWRDTFIVKDGAIQVSYAGYETFALQFGHLFYKTPFKAYRLRRMYKVLDPPLPAP